MSKIKILQELNRYKIGTCAEMVYRNALFYPDQECLIFGDERMTFSAFNNRVNRLVNALMAMGLKKGDVIGVLSWNSAKYLEVSGAAMKGGFILSPFNARLNEKELRYLVNYSQAKVLFVGEEHMDMARTLRDMGLCAEKYISMDVNDTEMISYDELLNSNFSESEPNVSIEEDDPLLIIYTSGTTGLPRGALYNHRRFIEDTKTYVMMTGIQPEDKYVMIMPLFHIGGTKVMWSYFYVGGSIVLLPTFDSEATLKAIEKEKATDIHIVPTHLSSFFALPNFKKYDLTSMKRMWYAASPMPLEMLKQGLDLWGPVFIQGYGSTETGPNACCLRNEEHKVTGLSEEEQKRLMSCGRPNLGVHVRIVNNTGEDIDPYQVGEIIISGNTMIGFWQKPEDTAERVKDGFVYTGDMGYYDDKGYIYIVDRKNDMIITGGENVFPREVEEVLYGHPAVREAAVIGIPDDYWVERVHAVVVCKDGIEVTDKELVAFCRERLAKYKAPKTVEFMESLPKNPAGKILKRELREKYRQK
ncbi:MAG: long-chain fatty acid--CoA ligase [Syntrophus sp. (in: bacteria)]|nr:long-chain fatty acid--CoA ligase [Syntrophus sp. (in: bacteria)]